MKTRIAGLLCSALLVVGGAQAETPQTRNKGLEQFLPYLQDTVDHFPFQSVHEWQAAGPDKVAVWPTAGSAYLLTVETPCAQLETTTKLDLTAQTSGIAMRGTDFVTAGSSRCRILEIEPIDLERMQGTRGKAAESAGDRTR